MNVAANTAATPPEYRVPDTGCRIPGSEYRVPDTGFRLPGSGFRIPGSDYRLPATPGARPGYRLPTRGSWPWAIAIAPHGRIKAKISGTQVFQPNAGKAMKVFELA